MAELEILDEDRIQLRIGKIKFNNRESILYVDTSDSNIPYFCLDDIKIRIFESGYIGDSKLDNEDVIILDRFLSGTDNNFPELYENSNNTIWERVVQTWSNQNDLYSDYKEKDNIQNYKKPNYTLLNNRGFNYG